MTIEEVCTAVLCAAELAATDPDSDEGGRLFTGGGVTGGQFELVANPGIAITSFTQAEVTAGEVRFVHDGGEAAPAYQVSVSDGALTSGPTAAAIDFAHLNDAPPLTVNSLTIEERDTVVHSTANRNASTPDSPPPPYPVRGVQTGSFARGGE